MYVEEREGGRKGEREEGSRQEIAKNSENERIIATAST